MRASTTQVGVSYSKLAVSSTTAMIRRLKAAHGRYRFGTSTQAEPHGSDFAQFFHYTERGHDARALFLLKGC